MAATFSCQRQLNALCLDLVQVLQHELLAIREACIKLEKDYQPGITFVVVQKRHHTRLFCMDRNERVSAGNSIDSLSARTKEEAGHEFEASFLGLFLQVGKSGNIPAGTTVDTKITHPSEFDFYLCSHAGIQVGRDLFDRSEGTFHAVGPKGPLINPNAFAARREPAGHLITMCSGMTTTSLQTNCKSSPTSCATRMCAAPGLSPSQHQPTMPIWWLSAPVTTWWTKSTTGKNSDTIDMFLRTNDRKTFPPLPFQC